MRTKTTLVKAVKFVSNCKFIFSFKKNIFQKNVFPILLCFFTASSFAQTKNIDSYLISDQDSDINHLTHLLYDLQSAVYYYADEGSAKVYGDNPTALYTDISSINSLGSASIATNDIEIATIKIGSTSDLSKSINLASFSGFAKLKYIYIISEVQTSEAVIQNMIKNDSSKYVIIYKISIGG